MARITVTTLAAQRALKEALAILEEVDGKEYAVDSIDGAGSQRHAPRAHVSRELQRAEALCQLAAAETSTMWWKFKGHPDPRAPRSD